MSPNTLRAWERRFCYPKPQRSAGRHPQYTHGEVAALREALSADTDTLFRRSHYTGNVRTPDAQALPQALREAQA